MSNNNSNAPKSFIFKCKGDLNTYIWKPDFEKDKEKWAMHFARIKKGLTKQFQHIDLNLNKTPPIYSIESEISINDINMLNGNADIVANRILSKENIKIYWNALKTSNTSTCMKFVIGEETARDVMLSVKRKSLNEIH